MITCTKCGTTKSRSEFYETTILRRGDRGVCKTCHKARNEELRKIRMAAPKVVPEQKQCSECKTIKPAVEFSFSAQSKDGLWYRCRECMAARGRMAAHQIDKATWDKMLEEQGGGCAICHGTDRLNLDHDHACCPGSKSCGKCARGILCHNCNLALGHMKDDIERLRTAIAYLSR